MAKTRQALIAVMATAAALFAADSAVAAEGDQVRIVLHVTDYSHVPPALLGRAQAEVAAVYGRIGVDVVWTGPVDSEDDTHSFTVVILSRERGLKMIATDGVADNVMGLALKMARRSYVFEHRVREISAHNCLDYQKFLGKVLAHEVGHLLLTNGHAADGIMQPSFQVRTNRSEWFTPTQGATIRAALVGAANGN